MIRESSILFILHLVALTSPSAAIEIFPSAAVMHIHDNLLAQSLISSRRQLEANDLNSTDVNCTNGAPFLWRIAKNESSELVGFGVGTIHLPVDLVTTNTTWASITNALEDVCEVYGELDTNDVKTMAAIQSCTGAALANAPTIADIPDESLREAYNDAILEMAEGLGEQYVPIVAVFPSLPIFLVQQAIQAYNTPGYRERFFEALLQGQDPATMDGSILEYGRPTGALETAETQCNVLTALNPSVEDFQSDFDNYWRPSLEETLSTPYTELMDAYKCGGMDLTLDLVMDVETSFPEDLETLLLDDRNAQMAAEMVRIMETTSMKPLFAVGLAHWEIGNSSLEKLLQSSGYIIERVSQFYSADEFPDVSDEVCAETSQLKEEGRREEEEEAVSVEETGADGPPVSSGAAARSSMLVTHISWIVLAVVPLLASQLRYIE